MTDTDTEEKPPTFADLDQDVELKHFLKYVNSIKEAVVADMDPEVPQSDDIPPAVRLIRTGGTHGVEVIAWAPRMDRDLALNIIEMLSIIEPDIITIACDAHVTRQMTNPVTGEKWGPGEMQNLCDNEGACSTGLLTDCITATTVHKTGRTQMSNYLYEVNKTDKTVTWLEPTDEDPLPIDTLDSEDDGHLTGLIPDTLREIIDNKHPMLAVAHQMGEEMGVPPLERQARLLCGVLGLLMKNGVGAMIRTDSEEAATFYQGVAARYSEPEPELDEEQSKAMDSAVSAAADLIKQEIERRKADKEQAHA